MFKLLNRAPAQTSAEKSGRAMGQAARGNPGVWGSEFVNKASVLTGWSIALSRSGSIL